MKTPSSTGGGLVERGLHQPSSAGLQMSVGESNVCRQPGRAGASRKTVLFHRRLENLSFPLAWCFIGGCPLVGYEKNFNGFTEIEFTYDKICLFKVYSSMSF